MPDYLEVKKVVDEHLGGGQVVGDWIMTKCPYHDDSNPSFGISLRPMRASGRRYSAGGFNCFACGAHGTWPDLLKHLGIEEGERIEAMSEAEWQLLKDSLNETGEEPIKWPGIDVEGLEHVLGSPRAYSEEKAILTTDLEPNYYTSSYLHKRGLRYKTIKDFEFLYSKRLKDFVFIPVKAINGQEVLWVERRRIVGDGPKYWRPKGVRKELVLFNYHNIVKSNMRWCCLVEGIFDAIKLHQFGVPAVCCFASLSPFQRNLLVSRFDTIYICFDGDTAGRGKAKKARALLHDTGTDVTNINLPNGKDPDDMAGKIAKKLGENRPLLS